MCWKRIFCGTFGHLGRDIAAGSAGSLFIGRLLCPVGRGHSGGPLAVFGDSVGGRWCDGGCNDGLGQSGDRQAEMDAFYGLDGRNLSHIGLFGDACAGGFDGHHAAGLSVCVII